MKNTEPVVVHCSLTRPRAGVSCVLERVRRPESFPGIDMDCCVVFVSVGVRRVRLHPPVHACMRERERARTHAFMRSAHTH